MANKKIICYIQYALKLILKSPLCVSGGADEATDRDVQKDFDGTPFIPGTSLAGALRSYLEECADRQDTRDIDKVFGYSAKSDGYMSRVKISDLRFAGEKDSGVKIITRDGIKLQHKLTVKGAKFDMEAVDSGAVCECFMLLTIREGDDKGRLEAVVERALAGLMYGEIRLGANKNRGFGELEVLKAKNPQGFGELEVLMAKKKEFSKENIKEWLDFDREKLLEGEENELVLTKPEKSRYLTIRVRLKQKGGISIRRYSVVPGTPDYEHITSNSLPVIPGSSWNGAIRSRVEEILMQLGIDFPRNCIDEWFGYVSQDKKEAKQSNIVISESVIQGGVDLPMTRTKINRYNASVMSGALYSEKSHFDGTLELEIKVRKNYCDQDGGWKMNDRFQYEPIVGMLLIAVKDIANGYLAVGGQTAVGRGIFEAPEPIELSGTDKDEEYFINAVSALCLKEKCK